MNRKLLLLFVFLISDMLGHAQTKAAPDSTDYYDELFTELDSFMDSLLAPRTMVLVNVGFSNSYLNYTTPTAIRTERRLSIGPSLGYFSKKGWGLSVAGSIVRDSGRLQLFQAVTTGSYGYLKRDDFATGMAFSRFFTKKGLSFYTSPLQNEISSYFTYKGWWVRPTFSATYGWGSRTAYEQRQETLKALRLRPAGYTYIITKEKVSDFTVVASVRHDFYWMNKLGKKSVLRLSPQLSLTSGTQRFGFNQTSNSYASLRRASTINLLYNTDNVVLDEQRSFQPLSLTAFLKTEWSYKKFYIQPQLALDYYFPAFSDRINTVFTVNLGAIF